MNNKRLLNHILDKTMMCGFGILEFLVASLLSMIVLMAVSSTYPTACGLNKSASTRIGIQQDLRNVVNMIVCNAHMTGNFGRFNMSNFPASAATEDKSSDEYTLKTVGANNLLPVKETDKLSYVGFARTGKVLLFQYGIDKANPVVKTVTVSSCSDTAKPQTEIKDLSATKMVLKMTDPDQDGSIAIMKHEMIAYAAGGLGEKSGLFCFQLSDDGSWGNPQLLIKDVTAMDIHYIYEGCPHSENTSASGVNIKSSDYKTALDSSAEAKSPASIQIVLNNGSIDPSKEQDNKVDIYNIDATIRGGNACADRSL